MFKFLKKFLKNLEQQNNKTFGNGRLDCCDLNKSNKGNGNFDKKSK
ncbi:hypothetical protein NRP93_003545 [Clostridium botulinum]|nr:hypothetical protein [Clostridium botulinum]